MKALLVIGLAAVGLVLMAVALAVGLLLFGVLMWRRCPWFGRMCLRDVGKKERMCLACGFRVLIK